MGQRTSERESAVGSGEGTARERSLAFPPWENEQAWELSSATSGNCTVVLSHNIHTRFRDLREPVKFYHVETRYDFSAF